MDAQLRVFGATGHKYALNSRASLASITEIEHVNRIELPADYRYFMLEVSDGGAGPNYGIKSICDVLRGSDPSVPFNSRHCSGRNPVLGVIWLTDNGCATTTDLIVNDYQHAGRTCQLDWESDRVVMGSLFRRWYLNWLNGAIKMLVKEPILKRVKKKMKLGDVRELLGNELISHDPKKTLLENYYLTFPDVNGGIQFDFSDRVVSTHFFPHCLTPNLDDPSDQTELQVDWNELR
ncbi:MAG: SMI1/KNR4 family protein [Pirellulales bacterium]